MKERERGLSEEEEGEKGAPHLCLCREESFRQGQLHELTLSVRPAHHPDSWGGGGGGGGTQEIIGVHQLIIQL